MMVCHLFTIFGNTNITKTGCCILPHWILLNITFAQEISVLQDEGISAGKSTLWFSKHLVPRLEKTCIILSSFQAVSQV